MLLQRGKGAEAGAGFGAGASGTVFGARGATHRAVARDGDLRAIFMINSLALAYLGTSAVKEQPKTILDEAAPAKTLPAPASAPAAPPPAAPATAPAQNPAPAPK